MIRRAQAASLLIAIGGLSAIFAAWGAPSAPTPWENPTAREAWAQAYAQLGPSGIEEFPWQTSSQGESCEAALYYASNSAERYAADTSLCLASGGGSRGVSIAYGQRESDGERRQRLYAPPQDPEDRPASRAFPPQGGGSRNVGWRGFEFYIVDERNPAGAGVEYQVALTPIGGGAPVVSAWSGSKCRVFDSLPRGSGAYYYSIVARNRDGVVTAAADRRAGEGARNPETVTTRTAEMNNDAWVTARVNDLQAIYGLTPAAVNWLNNGLRIERKRASRDGQTYLEPGFAGFIAGAYVGIGQFAPDAFIHESMHALWESWNGFSGACDRMNFYTFKRDQAQFILDFREYDRTLGEARNPWNAWRPLYMDTVGWLIGEVQDKQTRGDLPSGDAWDVAQEILANREFYKVGGFYHRYETIYPAMAARRLSLVPPPLQKYFRGFMTEGESRTWAQEIAWYSRLGDADGRGSPSARRLWNIAFATRDVDGAAPEHRAPGSSPATSIPSTLRTTLRNADRQRLTDWINTLDEVDWEGTTGYSFKASDGFWRDYAKNYIYSSQIYLDELSLTTGITLSSSEWTAVKSVMKKLESLYCGSRTVAQLRTDVTGETGLSATQRIAFGKMVDVYEDYTSDVQFSRCLT